MADHAYERIAAHYREQITSGALAPGDKLPSSARMADEWDVSRATTRRVLEVLKTEGLATALVGSGTVVGRSTASFGGNIAANATHVTVRQMVAGFGDDAVMHYTYAGYETPPPDVAEALHLAADDEVIRRSRNRTRHGRPVTMSTSWHPAAQAHAIPRLLVPENIDGGLAAIEQATGQQIGQLTERVAAALATADQAEFFELKMPAAVLLKEHLWLDTTGRPFCFGQGVHPGGEWTEYDIATDG